MSHKTDMSIPSIRLTSPQEVSFNVASANRKKKLLHPLKLLFLPLIGPFHTNTFVFHPDTVEKKEWPAEGRTVNLIWQPANCAKPTTLVSAWPMSVWALTLAQDNQLLTRCSHSLLYLAFSFFVKKLLIPEVCMYCMYIYICMYKTLQ